MTPTEVEAHREAGLERPTAAPVDANPIITMPSETSPAHTYLLPRWEHGNEEEFQLNPTNTIIKS
eukprot:887284-Prorocentrum_minimum.AAC.5